MPILPDFSEVDGINDCLTGNRTQRILGNWRACASASSSGTPTTRFSKRILFVSKMDSYPDVQEHESCAKRIKLDICGSDIGELCNGGGFSCFSAPTTSPIDITEGTSADCDSGYKASTVESIPTPSHHTSPHTDSVDIHKKVSSLSGSFLQTPSHIDQLDTSQDSLEVDDDNASTVSGLSDLSGQDWKPKAGCIVWIQQQIQKGVNPRRLLSNLGVDYERLPDSTDDVSVWKIIINMLAEPSQRDKLRHVNTLDDIVRLLKGTSADCDSGYEASTLESIPTPSHHTSPHTDPGDIHESMSSLSGSFLQTSTHTDQLDTSQDSLEVDDDNASTVSELSGLSDLSGQDWKPKAGSMVWIQEQIQKGVNPRALLSGLGVDYDQIPEYVDDVTIWKIIINMLAEPPRRNKLRHVNTLDDVVRLLKGAQNIIVLTGAGVSVSCGIPDFRSRDGIYSRLAIDFPNLPDPQAMFDISYFSQDPRPFFKFAKDIYPGKFQPSPCHRFIKLLEKHRKLLRNYTQNIDTLEKVANIDRVIECHGSFATATCTNCSHKVTADHIRDMVLAQKIPSCEVCHKGEAPSFSTDDPSFGAEGLDYRKLVASGIMKPDIVFFGEGLPDTFHEAMAADKSQCDLLLVIGSSLKVRPVALIPSSLPPHVPQILINREPLPHCHFDVELLGDCDVIINHLCRLLGNMWEEGIYSQQVLQQATTLLPLDEPVLDPERNYLSTKQTEPSYTVTDKIKTYTEEEFRCGCNVSTKTSSLSIERTVESGNCICYVNFNKSIINKGGETMSFDSKTVKERHMSIDSARDSGIGDNSNFTDLEAKYDDMSDENFEEVHKDDGNSFHLELVNNPQRVASSSESYIKESQTFESSSSTSDLRGYWQPKVKKSLADRLPNDSFHLVPPSRYIFPGAEVYYDPDEKLHYEGDSSNSDSSDSESEADSRIHSF